MNPSRLTWIDTSRNETWIPGLRAAVLLLRCGQRVVRCADAADDQPYLAVCDLPDIAASWFEERGVIFSSADDVTDSDHLEEVRVPVVAVFGGAGSPYNHAAVLAELGIPWFYATGPDIVQGMLRYANVLAVPGGGWRHGNGQLTDLGEDGTKAVLRFVEEGGGYLASCAGSLIAMRIPDESLRTWHPTKLAFTLLNVENWEPLRDGEGGHKSPGIGRVATRLASPRHPVAYGLPPEAAITHYNGPIFAEPNRDVSVIARYAGVTDGFTPSECFFSRSEQPSCANERDTLMAEAGRLGLPAVVAGQRGRGRIVLAGLHPEFGLDPALDAWARPAQLVGNAALWQAQLDRDPAALPVPSADFDEASVAMEQALRAMKRPVRRLQEIEGQRVSAWQEEATLRAAFGQTPADLWRTAVACLPELVSRVEHAWAVAEHTADSPNRTRLAAAALDRYEPDGGADLGAQGAVWLLNEASRLIDEASNLLERGGPDQVIAEERVSRSYLSARGVLTNAAQRLESEAAMYAAGHDVARIRELFGMTAAVAAV